MRTSKFVRKMSEFPIGEENIAFKDYFIGKSYLASISNELISIANLTFEPGCRNNWHIHHSKNGGGQILSVFLVKEFIKNGEKIQSL